MHQGHCLCGQLRFATVGQPGWVSYCHCSSCRRHTASPISCFVNFKIEQVSFSGARTLYESSEGVTRSHCSVCGTPISYETMRRANEIDLYLNAFDDPQCFQPQGHAFFAEHIPWFDTRDDLPRE
ncbi:MAG: GFA family protein [Halioglobus sp.]